MLKFLKILFDMGPISYKIEADSRGSGVSPLSSPSASPTPFFLFGYLRINLVKMVSME